MASSPNPLRRRSALLLLAVPMVSIPLCQRAEAASQITPTLLDFAPGQMAATLEFANLSDTPLSIDTEVVSWSQSGDKDIQAPSDEVAVSPPAASIPPGARQTLRVILRRRPDGEGERGYRLLINEMPTAEARNRGIAFEVVHSLPIFTAPLSAAPGRLQWRTERGRDGDRDLVAVNTGGRYVRFRSLTASADRGPAVRLQPRGQLPYALPGNERRWRLIGLPPGLRTLMLKGETQLGAFEQAIPLGP